jgi:hypothetical protein
MMSGVLTPTVLQQHLRFFRKTPMKRLICVLMLIVLGVAGATAQQAYTLEVSLGSGIVLPTSPMTFADYWKIQYGGGLRVGVPLSSSVTLFGSVEHYQFKLNVDGVNKAFDTQYMRDIWIFKSVSMDPSADASSVTTLSGNARVVPANFSGLLSPYFTGGFGVLRFSLKEIKLPTTSVLSVNGADIAVTAQQTVIGGDATSAFFQFGMGFDIHVSHSFDAFVEARSAIGLNSGLRTSYVPILCGVKMRI